MSKGKEGRGPRTVDNKQEEEVFSYVVAYPYPNGTVAPYTYFTQVHTGKMKDAEAFREYVKGKSPNHPWKIYKLTEITE